ncbi:GSU2403 family nucleotidyltransferase fold protein [Polaromonas sp. YR568]|uniref:GSU2403 family nucleotidyltransferase fold protein n=1 Tax=Polaromonas sp. YR568 TaxID=1855301 RepID=UPI00398BDD6B
MNQILELSPHQTRQYIDAETVFLELQRARREAAEVRGSMFWRTQSGTEYLIRESSGGGQKSLGSRGPETEQIYERFKARKEQAQSRLAALSDAAKNQQRLNKALRVGRVPGIVIKTLNALQAAGLQDHFMTIGTHSLYAYESACGVRFTPDAMATQDIDLLFDSRKRISFMSRMKKLDSSFIGALQKADPTFRVMPDQRQTAINDSGFEVDVIRRLVKDGDPHPFRMSSDENDLWAVQVEGGDKMLNSERFSQVVVAETGHMAVMNTMNPITFIALKKMMSMSAGRDPRKRLKDGLQAELVQQLVQTHMPQYVK